MSGYGKPPRSTGARAATPPAAAARVGAGSVRVIAGNWRGRRIVFPPVEGLRPTPDRVREALFNWLQAEVADRRALDLFAGSGALGLEALSRGARAAVFVEQHRAVAEALSANLERFGAVGAEVVTADVFGYLRRAGQPFDLVFLDPPFAQGRLTELCTLLEQGGWLCPQAFIYIERAADADAPILPANWPVVRETRAGEVRASLVRRVAVGRLEAGSVNGGEA